MESDRQLLTLAAQQGGIIRRDQAIAYGLTPGQITYRVQTGRWKPIYRGVYLLLDLSSSSDRIRAAIAALPGAVVSHEAAAQAHAIPFIRQDLAVVSVHSQTTHEFLGVTVHRCHDLLENHVVAIDDLPTTTLARTVVDLAAILTTRHLGVILDDLLATKRVSLEAIHQVAATVWRRGKPGATRMRALIAERAGVAANASRLELLGLGILRQAGLPDPEIEYPLPWNRLRRFDAAYPTHRVAIEWDSRRWHSQLEAFDTDRRRDRDAVLHGWRLVRFTWDDVTERPDEVASTVTSLLQDRLESDQERAFA